MTRDSRGRLLWWQESPSRNRVVSTALESRIEHAVSWVLNPLSHSQAVDHYRAEIEDAIYALDELEGAIRVAVALRDTPPRALRELLVSVLKLRPVPKKPA